MKKLNAIKPVYSYPFPETMKLLHEVESKLPYELFKVTTPAEKVSEGLESLFNPPLEIPSNLEENILDFIHMPIIKRIIKVYSKQVPSLGQFKHSYPTSGSSEGLFHILAKYKVKGIKSINVLEGEYEGYSIQAKNLGMGVNTVGPDEKNIDEIKPGVWFISNPSARDGNIIPNEFIKKLCDSGHKIVLDLAYVGATKPHFFDISHENISEVVMSFSKPYGVFRFRMGGFVFSREEIPTLIGNKWFKDVVRLLQALKLAEEIGPSGLYDKYRPMQENIIKEINNDFKLNIKPSDSLLLAYLTKDDLKKLNKKQLELIAPFKRGNKYRFCLTPYFEEKERVS